MGVRVYVRVCACMHMCGYARCMRGGVCVCVYEAVGVP